VRFTFLIVNNNQHGVTDIELSINGRINGVHFEEILNFAEFVLPALSVQELNLTLELPSVLVRMPQVTIKSCQEAR
jgi:hypothetical protein